MALIDSTCSRCPQLIGFSILLVSSCFAEPPARIAQDYGKVPLYFEENRGQVADARARYVARGSHGTSAVTADGLRFSLRGEVITMRIAGANPHARLEAEGPIEGVSNYYLGSLAIAGLKHYTQVRAANVRPGIDVVYHGSQQDIEYDLVIRPGAKPEALRLSFEGGSRPRIDENGDLVIHAAAGEVRQHKPKVWQEQGGKREEIECRYALAGKNRVRLVLGRFNREAELVVDPVISYSTFLGGSGQDTSTGIAVDSSGFAYVVGYTYSTDFPITSGSFHGSSNANVFVTKLNATGTGLVYSTLIGGTSTNVGTAIAIDNAGNAYVTGYTGSTDFPFTIGRLTGGQHAFALKLGSIGAITYAAPLSGTGPDNGTAISVDASGAAYIAGNTSSTNFPVTVGSYRTSPAGGQDGFVVKLTADGQISYATYLGGSLNDNLAAIVVDASGNAYVGGLTTSMSFPTTAGAFQTAYAGNQDGFVAKLNAAGSALLYSTYLGGSQVDTVNGLAIDAAGNCYVAGSTQSVDFPVSQSAFSTNKPSPYYYWSAFVSKLSTTGIGLVYSTFVGGNSSDSAAAIAVDSSGLAYVTGTATSGNFPTTPGALRTRLASSYSYDQDVFSLKVAADGSALSYATLLGTSANETPAGVALDGNGGAYLTGGSGSSTYPTTSGAFQPSTTKTSTLFITKIDSNSPTLCNPSFSPASVSIPGRGGPVSSSLTLAPGCPWEALADNFIRANAPNHGVISTSPITISGTVLQNNSTSSGVTGGIHVGAATLTVNQDPGSCLDPVITPLSVSFDSSGGIRNLNLVLPSPCSWSAVSSVPWLYATANATGTGPATITLFAGPNSFSTRNATLTISGKSISVTQTGSTCTATASASISSVSAQGGTGLARITTNSSSCVWAAYSTVPWIQLTGINSTGQGNGGVPFVVASNPGTLPRTGQILIGDQTLTLNQSAGPVGTISGYTVTTFAGGGSSPSQNGDGGPALFAYLDGPRGLAFDPAGNSLYIAEYGASRVRVITPDGNINTFAGGGAAAPDNVPATSAQLSAPTYVAVDGSSSVYVNHGSNRVLKVSQGITRIFAGTATTGFSGDNGAALSAQFNNPLSLAVDSAQNPYVADSYNNRVRKIANGIVTTIAGGGTSGIGDNGAATSAALAFPSSIAFDSTGNLYISDTNNGRIRRVAQGTISTVAGGGSGGDGPATSALLYYPGAIAFDPLGSVLIVETGYNRIRKLSSDGTLSTIQGLPYGSYVGLATDPNSNAYVSDSNTGRVLKLTPTPSFCTYSMNAPATQAAGGGSLSIPVSTAAGCNWTAVSDLPWLTITAGASGSGNGTVQITVAPNTGSARSGNVAIAGQFVTVAQSSGQSTTMSVNRTALNFVIGVVPTPGTSSQFVTVSFSGPPLNWSVSGSTVGFTFSPSSGYGNGTIRVNGIIPPSGVLTVTAPGAIGSPKQIPVNLVVTQASPPFGSFDTPVNNTSGIAGAIAVTGWALDNIEISKVDIWRERVGAEPVSSNGFVYIGDAVFVDGARPDVQAAYANTPWNYRAGWGYLLLTNFLPVVSGPLGNGTYKLHAIAHNTAGMTTDLGTRTITVDNAHASKPFGTIDTPAQGATISGNNYVNFGWALTQNPYCIPNDGSTLTVYVDGVPLGHPVYNQNRSDVAGAFPGLCNSLGAVGYYFLDTTTLTNGVHTIGWVAYDNQNRGDGIGSRFFNVLNSGGAAAPEEAAPILGDAGVKPRRSDTLESLKRDTKGAYRIEVEELDRIEIDLGAASADQLPIGSTLRGGVFYWQLGPGFLGEYPLTFHRADGSELNVRVVVSPTTFSRRR